MKIKKPLCTKPEKTAYKSPQKAKVVKALTKKDRIRIIKTKLKLK